MGRNAATARRLPLGHVGRLVCSRLFFLSTVDLVFQSSTLLHDTQQSVISLSSPSSLVVTIRASSPALLFLEVGARSLLPPLDRDRALVLPESNRPTRSFCPLTLIRATHRPLWKHTPVHRDVCTT